MKVRLQIEFEEPTAEDEANLTSVARSLSNDRQSVRVFPRDDDPSLVGPKRLTPPSDQENGVGTPSTHNG
jgi:hypothetical protein